MAALTTGLISAGSLIAFLLADRAIAGSGKDPAKALARLQGREAFAESEALGVLSEAEGLRGDVSRIKQESAALSPEALEALLGVLGTNTEPDDFFNPADLRFLGTDEVASILGAASGDPTLVDRILAGSNLPVPLSARGLELA